MAVEISVEETGTSEPEEEIEVPEWESALSEIKNLFSAILSELQTVNQNQSASSTLVQSLLETNTRLVTRMEEMSIQVLSLTPPPLPVIVEVPAPESEEEESPALEIEPQAPPENPRRKLRTL